MNNISSLTELLLYISISVFHSGSRVVSYMNAKPDAKRYLTEIVVDGTCYIEILIVPGKVYGQMSLSQFGQAAFTLFDVCVKHYGYGGVAANIGEFTNSSEQRQQREAVPSSPAIFNTAVVLRRHS